MLNRLVRRAIFAKTDAVMRHHENSWDFGQSCKTHRRTRIIGEAHECATVWADAAVQDHAVHRRGHAVLTDAPVNVAPFAIVRVEHAHITGLGIVRPCEIRGTTNSFLHDRVHNLQRHLRGFARCHFWCALSNLFFERFDRCGQLFRCFERIGAVKLGLFVARDRRETLFPSGMLGCAA